MPEGVPETVGENVIGTRRPFLTMEEREFHNERRTAVRTASEVVLEKTQTQMEQRGFWRAFGLTLIIFLLSITGSVVAGYFSYKNFLDAETHLNRPKEIELRTAELERRYSKLNTRINQEIGRWMDPPKSFSSKKLITANKSAPQNLEKSTSNTFPFDSMGTLESAQATTEPTGGWQSEDILLWFIFLRATAFAITSLFFLYYAISLLRRALDSHRANSRELQRYLLDMGRAAWAIQVAMEVNARDQEGLPGSWLDGACRNLFFGPTNSDSEVSSLAALGALMRLGPELSLGPEGASVKVSPKAAKQAAKDAG